MDNLASPVIKDMSMYRSINHGKSRTERSLELMVNKKRSCTRQLTAGRELRHFTKRKTEGVGVGEELSRTFAMEKTDLIRLIPMLLVVTKLSGTMITRR
jgi:hypothetical protein